MKSKKSKQKFKPLSEATPEEMQEAFLMGGLWASSELEGHVFRGGPKAFWGCSCHYSSFWWEIRRSGPANDGKGVAYRGANDGK